MDNGNFLLAYWHDQTDILLKAAARSGNDFSLDEMHDLRVAIKKLRSVLQFKKALLSEPYGASLIPNTELFFRLLGQCRALDLSSKLLQDTVEQRETPFHELASLLQVARNLAAGAISGDLSRLVHPEVIQAEKNLRLDLSPLEGRELAARSEKLLRKKFRRIREKLPGLARRPHIARKDLKTFYYWLKLCPQGLLLSEESITQLEKLLDLLGDWHDSQVLQAQAGHLGAVLFSRGTPAFDRHRGLARWLEKSNARQIRSAVKLANRWKKTW
ncbi:MAG TPA: CHAD domain-containing protein [Chitinophagaceae bacterium]|nr:CHAD domain-containing protein [Chitinophagaceae bacterium]